MDAWSGDDEAEYADDEGKDNDQCIKETTRKCRKEKEESAGRRRRREIACGDNGNRGACSFVLYLVRDIGLTEFIGKSAEVAEDSKNASYGGYANSKFKTSQFFFIVDQISNGDLGTFITSPTPWNDIYSTLRSMKPLRYVESTDPKQRKPPFLSGFFSVFFFCHVV